MDSSIYDPNNPVPEVSPEDEWGDVNLPAASERTSTTVLPPKRPRQEAATGGQGKENEGFRIESNLQRRQPEEEGQGLEVQEIDGSVVRLDPELPAAEKVPRHFTFHERPNDLNRRRNPHEPGADWGRSKKQSVIWILGISFSVATVVVAGLLLLPRINRPNAGRPQDRPELTVDVVDTTPDSRAIDDFLQRQPEAEQMFRKFVSAPVIDEALSVVRNLQSVEALVRNAPRLIVTKEWTAPQNATWNVFHENGLLFGVLEGTLPDFSNFHAYFTMEDGKMQLDWKATAGFGSATFKELERADGDTSEIRAWIITSGFYTSVFQETEYQSYQMLSPDKESAVWCYTRRGEDADARIAAMFQSGAILTTTPEPKKATLKLSPGPDGALPNQWVVADLLGKEWITR